MIHYKKTWESTPKAASSGTTMRKDFVDETLAVEQATEQEINEGVDPEGTNPGYNYTIATTPIEKNFSRLLNIY